MKKMWETLVLSFCFAVVVGLMCFISKMARKLIRALKRRRETEPVGMEMATVPMGTSRPGRPIVIRNPIVRGARGVPSSRTTLLLETGRTPTSAGQRSGSARNCSRGQRQAMPNRYRNYQYSDTFKAAFVPPRCYQDPPSYETVMGSALREMLPPPYSSLQMTPTAPPSEDVQPLLESQAPSDANSVFIGPVRVLSHPLDTESHSEISVPDARRPKDIQ